MALKLSPKKTLLGGCLVAAMAFGLIAGCAPQPTSSSTTDPADATGTNAEKVMEDVDSVLTPEWDPLAPVVKELSDGTLIQRTPDENISASLDATAVLHHPTENVPANTYFTKADARGCNACHEDLAATIDNMPYGHHPLSNPLGLEASVQQCLQCHRIGGSTVQTVPGEFGTMIHALHMGKADCWNCHDASNNGTAANGQGEFDYSGSITGDEQGEATESNQMVLWDLVKHNKLRGITDIDQADMGTGFSWDTDQITDPKELFNVPWETLQADYDRLQRQRDNVPLDEEMFNSWTITVTGDVGQEMTWTLPELIEQAPSEEFVAKLNCTVNPTNGPYIGQVQCKGIPVRWLLEQAGLDPNAATVSFCTPDGPYGSDAVPAIMNENNISHLVYEMGGERLTWANGYPVMYVRGAVAAFTDVKNVSELQVSTGAGSGYGSDFRFGIEYATPSVGICNLHEGQIIKTGETHQFSGYVDAYNEPVVAVEISMDRGKTWHRFDVNGADPNRMVTWYYDFTPEADGAYCIAVRGISEQGRITEEYVEKMVVAKAEMPQPTNGSEASN